MREFDEIDRLFQDSFDAFEVIPDPSVKANIDNALLAEKRKRRFFFWLFPVLFAIGLPTYFLFKTSATKQEHEVAQAAIPVEKQTLVHQKAKTELREENASHVKPSKTNAVPNVSGLPAKSANDEWLQKQNSEKREKSEKIQKRNENNFIRSKMDEKTDEIVQNRPKAKNDFVEKREIATTSLEKPNQEPEKPKKDENSRENPSFDSTSSHTLENEANSIKIAAPKPLVKKWSVALYAGYDWSTKNWSLTKQAPVYDTLVPIDNFNRYTSQFYSAKFELNRRINPKFDVIVGLGYQWNAIRKLETYYFKDQEAISGGGTTTTLDTNDYTVSQITESQNMHVSSLVLPFGMGYSTKLNTKVDFRLAAVAEMSFGKLKKEKDNWELSNPSFRSVGLNLSIRPELNYSFGKMKLGIYGTINQPIRNQLVWTNFSYSYTRWGGGFSIRYPLQ